MRSVASAAAKPMIHFHKNWESLGRQAALEIIDGGVDVDLWMIYEGLYRFFIGTKLDPGEDSAEFCWTQCLIYDLENDGLVGEDVDDYYVLLAPQNRTEVPQKCPGNVLPWRPS